MRAFYATYGMAPAHKRNLKCGVECMTDSVRVVACASATFAYRRTVTHRKGF